MTLAILDVFSKRCLHCTYVMKATNMCSNFGGFRCSPSQVDPIWLALIVFNIALVVFNRASCILVVFNIAGCFYIASCLVVFIWLAV